MRIIYFFANLMRMESDRAKLLAGSLAVFLLLSLIIPKAGFAGVMLNDPVQREQNNQSEQSETKLASFDNYAGVFVGAGFMRNQIVDVDGFADGGNPGSVSDYDDTGFAGGALVGGNFDVGGFTLEVSLTVR